jgi:hypothetical protein
METVAAKTFFGAQLAQVAWVVKDITTAEKFFKDVLGIHNFGKVITIRAKEINGTYYGEPSDAEWLVSAAYSGGTFIELIQPVSGNSIFQDYLDKNPAGGLQHIAYNMTIAELDIAIAELTSKGYPLITSVSMPIARIVFFDTYNHIGVVTELIGLTEAGIQAVEKMKQGTFEL